MNPDAFVDVRNTNTKVVFIYLTAGDAGRKTGPVDRPYYLARNEGAKRAVRFMADEIRATQSPVSGSLTVNGHRIETYTYKNTISFFLNLPDGNVDGSGFPATQYASLRALRDQRIASITAVDLSATYFGWTDLVDTLVALVRGQAAGVTTSSVTLNAPEPDPVYNPGDHSDHLVTGLAAADIRARLTCASYRKYQGYVTSTKAVNLSAANSQDEAATFASLISGMADKKWVGDWNTVHKAWLGRNYKRIQNGDGSACLR